MLCAYATGVADNSKIGTFKADSSASVADLIANHYHGFGDNNGSNQGSFIAVNAYTDFPIRSNAGYRGWNGSGGGGGYSGDIASPYTGNLITSFPVATDGSSSSVSSLNPDTMYGVWVIKAFGLIVNADNTDVKSVLTNIADNNSKMSSLESRLGYDYIVSSWTSGTEWYRKWKSGWLEQGGRVVPTATGIKTVTLHLPFKSDSYAILTGSYRNYYADYYGDFISLTNKKTTSFDLSMYFSSSYNGVNWKAEGVSA